MAAKTESGRTAYVDTSALIAFLDRSDRHHELFRRLFADPPRLTASALVVAEGHGWFLRRYDAGRAVQFLSLVAELPVHIHEFGPSAIAATGKMVRRFADQDLTLADAHALVIMSEARISRCWSTDRHLALTGAQLAIQPR
jgi:predicted nucleic acid-binding protein